ncbi:4976_t:CDS:2 [Diversispora eburnea]|uniref:Origin recognition complex subunit 1 n=1 Tax=Diversispora eburnea TaxID=1213867 RepID=A0A9N8YRN6_9GLOM|nr:4976_t:CDS:2 [Diversispora eburnea]
MLCFTTSQVSDRQPDLTRSHPFSKRVNRRSVRVAIRDQERADFKNESDNDVYVESTETENELSENEPSPKRRRKNGKRITTSEKISQPGKITTPPKIRVKSIGQIKPLALRQQPTTEPQTFYDRARSMLRLEEVPDTLPCREKEYKQLYERVKSAIEQFSGHRIFISGQPGTGKTATVRQVVKNLQQKVEEKELIPFEFVEINGMEIKPPEKAYPIIWKALTGDHVTFKDAEILLAQTFSAPSRRGPILLMIDEFDTLVKKKSTVIYNLLNWTTFLNSYFIVIALTNRIDLYVNMLPLSSDSRMGLDRFSFAPYTHAELAIIVKSRLEGIDLFTNEAIEFAARKVSSITQDARNALCICSRAVGILESLVKKDDTVNNKVTIEIIKEAIKKTITPWSRYIRKCSFQAKLFLCSLYLLRKDEKLEIEYKDIAEKFIKLCKGKDIPQPTYTEISDIAYDLASSLILIMDPSKDICASVDFNANEEEVQIVLNEDPFFRDMIKL